MEFTGERVVPGQVEPDLWNEHVSRYAFAVGLARTLLAQHRPLRVLDAGCGSGYGSALLASLASEVHVTGVDVSSEAIDYARAHYSAPNQDFLLADCLSLPSSLGPFDLVVTFEMIEHLADPRSFLQAVSAMLAPGGFLVASTPNRRYYSEERDYTNPFHVREYDTAEFRALLDGFFPHLRLVAQNHVPALSFVPLELEAQPGKSSDGSAELRSATGAADEPYFLLAVCGRESVPQPAPFVFVPSGGNVLREREQHITKLEQSVAGLEAEIHDRDTTIRGLQAEYEKAVASAREAIRERDDELESRAEWARNLEKEQERLGEIIRELQAELETKVGWARDLDADLNRAREALNSLQQAFDERTAWALVLDAERRQRIAELEAARNDLALILGSFWYRAGKKLRFSPVPVCDQPPTGNDPAAPQVTDGGKAADATGQPNERAAGSTTGAPEGPESK